MKVELIGRTRVYDGHFKVDEYRVRHELYAGGMSPQLSREVFERGNAACVLPYDAERDEVVLIEQFRTGPFAHGDEPWVIEVIAGMNEPGEAPEDVVRREAREEAGLELRELVRALDFYVSPGGTSEMVSVYCAPASTSGVGGIHGAEHEAEDIRVLAVPFGDAMAMLQDGRIRTAPAVVALQWLALHRQDLRARWRSS